MTRATRFGFYLLIFVLIGVVLVAWTAIPEYDLTWR